MVEPPFFQNSVVHVSMLVAIVRQKDEIIFVLFQQSTMYKIPPVFFLSFL